MRTVTVRLPGAEFSAAMADMPNGLIATVASLRSSNTIRMTGQSFFP